MSDETSQRLERIEGNVAHLEHQVEQLNGVIIEQGKLVERLKREVQKQSTLLESQELDRIKANNPKPPHYAP
jgi:SlyX protein